MTTIAAAVVADSVPEAGGRRLTTLQLRYPWAIHPELLTHRALSRNASSMRAIPTERLAQDVLTDPYVPDEVYANRPGMQGGERLAADPTVWRMAVEQAVAAARALAKAEGWHKQHANRPLMPYAHVNVAVSATEWDNFFALRISPEAQPEMRRLAEAVRDAIAASAPDRLGLGEWHLPYVDRAEARAVGLQGAKRISVARCARVSYRLHDGRPTTIADDLALSDRLLASGHWSPFEHQAKPDPTGTWPDQWANFRGWRQHRQIVQAEAPAIRDLARLPSHVQ